MPGEMATYRVLFELELSLPGADKVKIEIGDETHDKTAIWKAYDILNRFDVVNLIPPTAGARIKFAVSLQVKSGKDWKTLDKKEVSATL